MVSMSPTSRAEDPHEAPEPLLPDVAGLQFADATRRSRETYSEPVKAALIMERLREIRDVGGTTVSAEHVSSRSGPLTHQELSHERDVPVVVGGCATHQAALHGMRIRAAGVLMRLDQPIRSATVTSWIVTVR